MRPYPPLVGPSIGEEVEKVDFWSYYSLIDIEYTLLGDPPPTPWGTPKTAKSDNLLAGGGGPNPQKRPFSTFFDLFGSPGGPPGGTPPIPAHMAILS